MRVDIDEAALLKDQFEEFIDKCIGQDVVVRRNPDAFTVEVLRKVKREPHPVRSQLMEDMECP